MNDFSQSFRPFGKIFFVLLFYKLGIYLGYLWMENNDLLRAAAQFTKTASTFGQMNGGSIPPSGPSGDPLSFLPVLSGNEYHYDHGNNMMDDGAGPKKISVSPTMTL